MYVMYTVQNYVSFICLIRLFVWFGANYNQWICCNRNFQWHTSVHIHHARFTGIRFIECSTSTYIYRETVNRHIMHWGKSLYSSRSASAWMCHMTTQRYGSATSAFEVGCVISVKQMIILLSHFFSNYHALLMNLWNVNIFIPNGVIIGNLD